MSNDSKLRLFGVTFFTLVVLVTVLSGCTSTGPMDRPMVGPYDISLTSHREALQ